MSPPLFEVGWVWQARRAVMITRTARLYHMSIEGTQGKSERWVGILGRMDLSGGGGSSTASGAPTALDVCRLTDPARQSAAGWATLCRTYGAGERCGVTTRSNCREGRNKGKSKSKGKGKSKGKSKSNNKNAGRMPAVRRAKAKSSAPAGRPRYEISFSGAGMRELLPARRRNF